MASAELNRWQRAWRAIKAVASTVEVATAVACALASAGLYWWLRWLGGTL